MKTIFLKPKLSNFRAPIVKGLGDKLSFVLFASCQHFCKVQKHKNIACLEIKTNTYEQIASTANVTRIGHRWQQQKKEIESETGKKKKHDNQNL